MPHWTTWWTSDGADEWMEVQAFQSFPEAQKAAIIEMLTREGHFDQPEEVREAWLAEVLEDARREARLTGHYDQKRDDRWARILRDHEVNCGRRRGAN